MSDLELALLRLLNSKGDDAAGMPRNNFLFTYNNDTVSNICCNNTPLRDIRVEICVTLILTYQDH